MENENQTADPAAPDATGSAADESLLNPDPRAEGAAATGEGSPGDNNAAEGAEGAPLLDPRSEEEKNPDVGAPETYEEFTLPEGFSLDDEVKEEISGMFKSMNISQAGAQKLIDAYLKRVMSQKEAEISELNSRRMRWRSEVRQKPTYESDKAFAQKGIRAVVNTPEGKALFQDTWLSDHPAVFGMFVTIGRLLGEDTPLPPGGPRPPAESAETRFPIKL